jgi:hypothetical protein
MNPISPTDFRRNRGRPTRAELEAALCERMVFNPPQTEQHTPC